MVVVDVAPPRGVGPLHVGVGVGLVEVEEGEGRREEEKQRHEDPGQGPDAAVVLSS